MIFCCFKHTHTHTPTVVEGLSQTWSYTSLGGFPRIQVNQSKMSILNADTSAGEQRSSHPLYMDHHLCVCESKLVISALSGLKDTHETHPVIQTPPSSSNKNTFTVRNTHRQNRTKKLITKPKNLSVCTSQSFSQCSQIRQKYPYFYSNCIRTYENTHTHTHTHNTLLNDLQVPLMPADIPSSQISSVETLTYALTPLP